MFRREKKKREGKRKKAWISLFGKNIWGLLKWKRRGKFSRPKVASSFTGGVREVHAIEMGGGKKEEGGKNLFFPANPVKRKGKGRYSGLKKFQRIEERGRERFLRTERKRERKAL